RRQGVHRRQVEEGADVAALQVEVDEGRLDAGGRGDAVRQVDGDGGGAEPAARPADRDHVAGTARACAPGRALGELDERLVQLLGVERKGEQVAGPGLDRGADHGAAAAARGGEGDHARHALAEVPEQGERRPGIRVELDPDEVAAPGVELLEKLSVAAEAHREPALAGRRLEKRTALAGTGGHPEERPLGVLLAGQRHRGPHGSPARLMAGQLTSLAADQVPHPAQPPGGPSTSVRMTGCSSMLLVLRVAVTASMTMVAKPTTGALWLNLPGQLTPTTGTRNSRMPRLKRQLTTWKMSVVPPFRLMESPTPITGAVSFPVPQGLARKSLAAPLPVLKKVVQAPVSKVSFTVMNFGRQLWSRQLSWEKGHSPRASGSVGCPLPSAPDAAIADF